MQQLFFKHLTIITHIQWLLEKQYKLRQTQVSTYKMHSQVLLWGSKTDYKCVIWVYMYVGVRMYKFVMCTCLFLKYYRVFVRGPCYFKGFWKYNDFLLHIHMLVVLVSGGTWKLHALSALHTTYSYVL